MRSAAPVSPLSHTTFLLILPGLGLRANDYAPLARASRASTYRVFDAWPYTADELRTIGLPGSVTYEQWMTQKCCELRTLLENTIPRDGRRVIFAHSAGGEFVSRMRLAAVCYGCRHGNTHENDRVMYIRGRWDTIVTARRGDIVVDSGHFGVVPRAAYERAQRLQEELGGSCIDERHTDVCAVVGRLVQDAA